MAQPSNLLLKLSRRLFAEERDRDAFVEALVDPQPFLAAIAWVQPRPAVVPFAIAPPLSWQPTWVDRLDGDQRPGQHALHQAGAYYCLDMASVFSAAVFSAIATPTESVLDLCAAPGGKSLLAWKALTPTDLWCNEVVRKRVRILISNLKRCGLTDSLVFNLDPQTFAEQLPHAASVVVVDAPCSGQSLLAKGDQALGCFHPVNIKKNASRQKRILASAAQTVAGDGYLAYMTCTFSPDENEQVVEWLMKKFPQFEAVDVPVLADYASSLAAFPCYRLWPQSGLGAGSFTSLLRNRATSTEPINLNFLTAKGMQIYSVERSP
ncbi:MULTISPECIES: RsmB/NOP family class I SAM-dependent RNA methyltransferase [Cyanophyceae]|uniref:RsmB/NOP family class I SAM-dependent RNA methyltransferase n=1 Tax=Cyanophyceae TaxID=3028117 RepID=UPI00168766B1|nr:MULTISPECIES: RsmB/NOP family class I SAM-dependent RNA methyltransferase [Cyanophyceae]MBD1915501.1 RsmB/NOP family class I SAM-dependent RNA methyltransferase [Phormidium sp. FACHB-77]MBD2031811.1 RsmB/NOP family class I SAM-dependent RNA methyltransferase [Phormidium sp. FACHB-322]MBD2050561.1 RsmB/NOP family class I SAM-dependent RNA methyltransferase [Leptolyngbya sp. FACHB-60]